MGKLIGFLTGFILIAILFAVVYYGLGWIKLAAPDMSFSGRGVDVFARAVPHPGVAGVQTG